MMSLNSRGAALLGAIVAGVSFSANVTSASGASLTAAPSRAHGYVDAQLRGLVDDVSPAADWFAGEEQGVASQVCANTKDMKIGIMRRPLAPTERRLCEGAGRRSVFQKKIGAIIVAPVAQPGAFSNLTTRQLHEALAAEEAPGKINRRSKWRDVDPALPDAPIRLLLPASGSPEDAALTTALMRACLALRAAPPTASAADRIASCARLRGDGAVTRMTRGQSASAWIDSSGPGALALVGYAQIVADAGLTGIVPLDGLLPQAGLRMRGEYPASLPVYLVATFSGRKPLESRDPATALGDALLAEGAIGPQGRAAQSGLAPPPAADRVTLRQDFGLFLDKGGAWE